MHLVLCNHIINIKGLDFTKLNILSIMAHMHVFVYVNKRSVEGLVRGYRPVGLGTTAIGDVFTYFHVIEKGGVQISAVWICTMLLLHDLHD